MNPRNRREFLADVAGERAGALRLRQRVLADYRWDHVTSDTEQVYFRALGRIEEFVDITEPPKSELSTLSQVLLGSLGLSGFLALMAITLGIALGGLMFWIKRRRSAN